ncbi:hypothetical protein EUTSA_v10009374mg [Eutrema salsugineum]|uniref:NAC domain-containing protein n=2 Tax=Eutrema salsugineum TaxID=72664 RepID=V4L1A1_EUTSA|nr:hypothetical protein EUTSA_v10009374mg [Eutrema salsugineum]
MTYPVGTRFLPNGLGLVRRYLRNKVQRNESEFIKTLNIYENDPWRLDHDTNPLYPENKWYYFVHRTTASRTVPGNRESEGGTWKNNGKKEIEDENKVVIGYKRSFVYLKKVNGNLVKTDWHMKEYSLFENKTNSQEWVLCLIKDREENKDIVLPNNERQEEEEKEQEEEQEQEADFANEINQHKQQEDQEQGQDAQIILPSPPLQSNDTNNVLMMSNQEPYGFDGVEDVMINIDEEQEQKKEEEQEADFANEINQHKQQQDQEQDALNLLPSPPLQSDDTNNVLMMSNQEPYGFGGSEDEIGTDELMESLDNDPVDLGMVDMDDLIQNLKALASLNNNNNES